MVRMELLQNIYAVFGLILLLLLFLAVLVAAGLPRERRKQVLQRLRRVQC
jgi:cbb3-type cytochrome oxidase subunit 3